MPWDARQIVAYPRWRWFFHARLVIFNQGFAQSGDDAGLFSALLFLRVVFFFCKFSPPKKRKGWIWNMHFVGNCCFFCCFLFFCFLKRPWPHSKINWLSSWSNWKSIRRFSASWCVPKPMKSGNLRDFGRKTPALEVTRRCQDVPSPFFFSGESSRVFNSTRHRLKRLKKWWFASFSWMIWGFFGWMPFSWILTWRKFVRPRKLEGSTVGVTGRLAEPKSAVFREGWEAKKSATVLLSNIFLELKICWI